MTEGAETLADYKRLQLLVDAKVVYLRSVCER